MRSARSFYRLTALVCIVGALMGCSMPSKPRATNATPMSYVLPVSFTGSAQGYMLEPAALGKGYNVMSDTDSPEWYGPWGDWSGPLYTIPSGGLQSVHWCLYTDPDAGAEALEVRQHVAVYASTEGANAAFALILDQLETATRQNLLEVTDEAVPYGEESWGMGWTFQLPGSTGQAHVLDVLRYANLVTVLVFSGPPPLARERVGQLCECAECRLAEVGAE